MEQRYLLGSTVHLFTVLAETKRKMSSFWRPFDLPSDEEEDLKPQSNEKNERMKIRVTEHEKELILDAYKERIDQGWDDVLLFIRHNVERLPLNSRVVEYYLYGEKEKVKRRIKRIVNEALKEASSHVKLPAGVGNDAKRNVAEETVQQHMRYAHKRTPLQRKEDKMGHFKDPNDQFSDTDEDETQTRPPKKKSLREMTADAQEAHQKMCQKAMASMEMMNNVMSKLNRKLDDM